MKTAISVSGLHKTFGRTRALDGLDLSVAEGEVRGFLGPNGADLMLRVLEHPDTISKPSESLTSKEERSCKHG